MKRIKETKAECLYIFQGRASANSEIVRNLAGAKEFIRSANERFVGFMKIRRYTITQDTWTMIVELESSESITNSYLKTRSGRSKAKEAFVHEEIWRMVSDCIRHWLSRFVKWTNFHDRREGSLRMKRYERFYFESLAEAEKYLDDMLHQKIGVAQKRKRFRPSKKKWALRKVGNGHVYLCYKNVTKEKILEAFGLGAISMIDLNSDVLRKLIYSTQKSYQMQLSHFSSCKME